MKIEMLKDLLCCVGEEKEDEPSVAYARQDDRSRKFFKSIANDRSLVQWSFTKSQIQETLASGKLRVSPRIDRARVVCQSPRKNLGKERAFGAHARHG